MLVCRGVLKIQFTHYATSGITEMDKSKAYICKPYNQYKSM